MSKIAKSISEGIELVNNELSEYGSAYLDWGVVGNEYLNISCKHFADEVGREFQSRGYFVYYQVMGYGSSRVAQGTPVCIRIYKEPKDNNSYVPFY